MPHSVTPDARRGDFSDTSIGELLLDRWSAVCSALDVQPEQWRPVARRLRGLVMPWGLRRVGTRPEYRSHVADDGLPFELSVNWSPAGVEIRALWETMGDPPTARSCQDAGAAVVRRMAVEPGVSIRRYLAIEPLFLAAEPPRLSCTVWHAVAWLPGEDPRYKVYLNPQAHGAAQGPQVLASALHRLGLHDTWNAFAPRHRELEARGHDAQFFALDLHDGPRARVKLDYVNRDANLAEVRRVLGPGLADTDGLAKAYRAMVGCDGRSRGKPPMTCLAFVEGQDRLHSANVYLPLPGNTQSDLDACERSARLFRVMGLDATQYVRVITALTDRPLAATTGLQEYLSYRTGATGPDMTIYLRFGVYDDPGEEAVPLPRVATMSAA